MGEKCVLKKYQPNFGHPSTPQLILHLNFFERRITVNLSYHCLRHFPSTCHSNLRQDLVLFT